MRIKKTAGVGGDPCGLKKKKGVKMFPLCAGNLGRDPAHKEHPYGNDIFWGKDIRRGYCYSQA